MERIEAHHLAAHLSRRVQRMDMMRTESEQTGERIDLVSAGLLIDMLYDGGYVIESRLVGDDTAAQTKEVKHV
jgi:hypothetical protein